MPELDYIMGKSASEVRRLGLQAKQLRPTTERLLRQAGLLEGMRVLDLGCGAGDVSVLAAGIVGRSGAVVGIDRDTAVLEVAKARAEQEGLAHVQFHQETLSSYAASEMFDFAIGRYVLFHQADPTAFIRDAARHVRPTGFLAFHEIDLSSGCGSCPAVPLWQETSGYIEKAFKAANPGWDAARRMVEHFLDAGLACPALFAEAAIGGGAESPLYLWMTETLRSVTPTIVARLLATEAELQVNGLEERLSGEVTRARAQVRFWLQVCAWVTV